MTSREQTYMALVDALGAENATRFLAFFRALAFGGGDSSDLPRFVILRMTPLSTGIEIEDEEEEGNQDILN